MLLFVLGLLFVLAALALATIGFPTATGRWGYRGFAVVPLVVGLLVLALSMYRQVGQREVGIPIKFGKVGKVMQAGPHLVAPWTSVTTCDLSLQHSNQTNHPPKDAPPDATGIPVQGKDQGSATLDVTANFIVDEARAVQVYQEYKCDITVLKRNLLNQKVREAAGVSAAQFDTADLPANKNVVADRTQQFLVPLFEQHGLMIRSNDVSVSDVVLSDSVQQSANRKVESVQAQQRASIDKATAEINAQRAVVEAQGQAQANKVLQDSLSNSPGLLCQHWIDALRDKGFPQVTNTAGPCGDIGAAPVTSALVQVK